MANINIGGRLHSTATGNVVAGANEILDDIKGKKQSVINQETDEALSGKQAALVSGTNIKTINNESILGSGNIQAGEPDAVKYSSQSLTDVQKAQARTNIDAYNKPSGGIPKADLISGVQASLDLANTAVQAENVGPILPPSETDEFATKTQVNQLDQKIDGLASTTFTTGSITSGTGATGSATNREYTDYIDVSGLAAVTYTRPKSTSASPSWGMAFYDGSKAYISGQAAKGNQSAVEYEETILTVPATAKYARFTRYNDPLVGDFWVRLNAGYEARIADLETDVDSLESRSVSLENEVSLMEGVTLTFSGATTLPLKFEKDKTYLVSSTDTTVTISFRVQESDDNENATTLRKCQAAYITMGKDYNYLRVGAAVTLFVQKADPVANVSIVGDIQENAGIATPAVGETLSPEPVAITDVGCIIKPVVKGDIIYLEAYRYSDDYYAYAFTDSSYEVLARGQKNVQYIGYVIAPEDGYFVMNCVLNYQSYPYDLKWPIVGANLSQAVSRIEQDIVTMSGQISDIETDISAFQATLPFADLKVPNGKVVTIQNSSVIIPSGSRITVKNKTYALSSDVAVSLNISGIQGYIVVYNTDTNEISAISATTSSIADNYAVLFSINKASNGKCSLPPSFYNYGVAKKTGLTERDYYAEFRADDTFFDFADDLAGVSFDNANLMDEVYAKFDALVTEYPDYITKVDAAQEVELNYPSYANGVPAGDPTYGETPAYKTYLYKFIGYNSYVNGDNSARKKLFLFGGVHGMEKAAQFNLFLFAKGLCERTTHDFYMKLRATYDVYIIPCVSGYGLYHGLRTNANGVNINRNFPVPGWSESGAGTNDYTGPSAGSEFETQLIMAQLELVAPDVVVDHHNYSSDIKTQFFNGGADFSLGKPAYASLIDCSRTFVKNLPAYFGNKYRLTINAANGSLPKYTSSNGTVACWSYHNITVCAFTEEICSAISYLNGELTVNNPPYTNDAFKVGEYTLRTCLVNYINAYQMNQLR